MNKLILFVVTIAYANSQYVGDKCILSHDNSRGTCKLMDQCPRVTDLLRCKRIKPTVCGFEGNKSIVCCPNRGILSLIRGTLNGCSPNVNTPVRERISQKKCKEYKGCETKFKVVIVGGIEASPGEFPHMTAIGWPLVDGSGYAWNCGGSLISENFVITAAHCTDAGRDTSLSSAKPTYVRLGAHDIKNFNDGNHIRDIAITAIIKHPEYKAPIKYHDIALLKLATPVKFGENVRPICLWQSTEFGTEESLATGWGRIGYGQFKIDKTSDTLQKVTLPLIEPQKCSGFYTTNRKLPAGIISEQLCAGELKGGKDTCQGDSGGPLQIADSELPCAYHLIGITSFGVGCGGKNSPAVYTRISSYLDWIESVVWPQN